MSEPIVPAKPQENKIELKVKAAAFTTYLLSLAAASFLATTATDFVHALPDWLEAIVYPLFLAAGTFVAGYAKRTRPDRLSESTVFAVQEWLNARMPRTRPEGKGFPIN